MRSWGFVPHLRLRRDAVIGVKSLSRSKSCCHWVSSISIVGELCSGHRGIDELANRAAPRHKSLYHHTIEMVRHIDRGSGDYVGAAEVELVSRGCSVLCHRSLTIALQHWGRRSSRRIKKTFRANLNFIKLVGNVK